MANNYIRSQAKLANIKLWEIADELNISDSVFENAKRSEKGIKYLENKYKIKIYFYD